MAIDLFREYGLTIDNISSNAFLNPSIIFPAKTVDCIGVSLTPCLCICFLMRFAFWRFLELETPFNFFLPCFVLTVFNSSFLRLYFSFFFGFSTFDFGTFGKVCLIVMVLAGFGCCGGFIVGCSILGAFIFLGLSLIDFILINFFLAKKTPHFKYNDTPLRSGVLFKLIHK